jgi:predicted nicotinamide N-methyase
MSPQTATIAGFAAMLTEERVGEETVALWQVADLERHVDRAALLAGENPTEPPYWAHLWSGARVLAAAIPHGVGTVFEIGCGLGLPGLTAARRGARVTFVDREPAPLAFVRASVEANGITRAHAVAADLLAGGLGGRADLVLAAELLYDRAVFPVLGAALARILAPRGRILIADARRIDTRAFYGGLVSDLVVRRDEEVQVHEEGFPLRVHLVEIVAR